MGFPEVMLLVLLALSLRSFYKVVKDLHDVWYPLFLYSPLVFWCSVTAELKG